MRRRIVLGLVVMGAALAATEVGALALCSGAEAATEFVYLLNGNELAAGKTQELLKAADETAYKFERTSGTPTVKFECKTVALAEKTSIEGGKPGQVDMKLEWSSCSGSVGGKSCSSISVKSTALHGEVVEELFAHSGFPATLLTPKTGEELIRFEGICGVSPTVEVIKGSLVTEPSSTCSKIQEVGFIFPGFTSNEVRTFGGEKKKIATTIEGSPALITGETRYFLFNSPNWGIC